MVHSIFQLGALYLDDIIQHKGFGLKKEGSNHIGV